MPGNASRGMLVLVPFLVGFACPATAAPEARVSETYGKLPPALRGESGTDAPGRTLPRARLRLQPLSHGGRGGARADKAEPGRNCRHERRRSWWRMKPVGAAPKPLVSGLDELPGK